MGTNSVTLHFPALTPQQHKTTCKPFENFNIYIHETLKTPHLPFTLRSITLSTKVLFKHKSVYNTPLHYTMRTTTRNAQITQLKTQVKRECSETDLSQTVPADSTQRHWSRQPHIAEVELLWAVRVCSSVARRCEEKQLRTNHRCRLQRLVTDAGEGGWLRRLVTPAGYRNWLYRLVTRQVLRRPRRISVEPIRACERLVTTKID